MLTHVFQKKPERHINKIKHHREKNQPRGFQSILITVLENLFKKFAAARPNTMDTIVAMYSKILILENAE